MDIQLALMTGVDIPIPEIQIVLHQPTIKEISYLGEKDYLLGMQCLLVTKMMINIPDKSLLANTTNFQVFMTVMQEKEAADKKQAVISVLQLILPNYQPIFTPRSIILRQGDQQFLIDENNFDILQEILKQIMCIGNKTDQSTFNPANDDKAREIAAKLMRGRERVAAQKGDNQGSMFARYISILTIGVPMQLSEAINLTMYQMYDLIERQSLYLNWDLDIRTRLAGGKPEGKTENWMKNIH